MRLQCFRSAVAGSVLSAGATALASGTFMYVAMMVSGIEVPIESLGDRRAYGGLARGCGVRASSTCKATQCSRILPCATLHPL